MKIKLITAIALVAVSLNFIQAQAFERLSIGVFQNADGFVVTPAAPKFYCLKCDDIGCKKIPCPSKD